MKADLYSASAITSGADGLAHRTAAGFVVLTSADGDDVIAMIADKQSDADLIDQIVKRVHADQLDAFAMLFTAGGDLYLIAAGEAEASLSSAASQIVLRAVGDEVLVHGVSAGINETDAVMTLAMTSIDVAAIPTELTAGTVQASQLSIAIGGATLEVTAPTAESEAVAQSDAMVEQPAAEADSAIQEAVEEPIPEPEAVEEPIPEPVAVEEPMAPVASVGAAAAAAVAAPEAAAAPVAAHPDPTPGRETASLPSDGTPVGPVMVLGVACPQGHHNHPDAVYCSQCGTKMGVHQTTVLVNGPRPPLGVLVVDDGSTYSLNEDLVVGRDPSAHQQVQAGRAQPMVLSDDTLSLSRQHARIWLDDWSVFVQDLGSSNGTFLSRLDQNEPWFKLDSSTSTALEPGDRLRVGGRIIQVELHHVR